MSRLRLLHLILLLRSGLCSLPAPLSVIVDSQNYRHVLRWDSAPDTPAGTLFKIYRRVNNKTKLLNSTTAKSIELRIDSYEKSHLFVVASYNGTDSPQAKAAAFTPFKDTKIGPPEVSLSPCGNCIGINISLPRPNIGSDEEVPPSDPQFKILWKKKMETKPEVFLTRTPSYTLEKLEKEMEYCVKVEVEIRTNKNTLPSQWKCIFTSKQESISHDAVLVAVGAVLIVFVGLLMMSIFFLSYIGFLCRKPTALPSALEMFLGKGCTLTPERTNLMSISCTESRRGHVAPAAPHRQDDPQDEEKTVYMDRNTKASSDERYRRGSLNGSASSLLDVSEDSGSLAATMKVAAADVSAARRALERDLDRIEAEAEEATVCFLPDEPQAGVQGHAASEEGEIQEEEEMRESSGNVNLFSVVVTALAVDGEEDPTRLLASDSDGTLSSTDYETAEPSTQPTHEDCAEPWREEEHADTQSSEEEEEEYSEYMSHS